MMIKDVQNMRVEKINGKDEAFQSPGDYVRFISPEVYKSNRQKYLRSYTFKSSYEEEEEADLSSKKQRKWFKNKKMIKFKKTSDSLGNSLKSCLILLFACFHV
ncbi:hypothetical protein N665_1343s0009 [Sinapis alba]|nr:hypothetical protein N665_1343s0009 [Sinapis alba]